VRLQAKLLRAIQERVIDRVGGNTPVKVDIRIIATSNRNLFEAVKEGTFREDLLYRLNVVNLKIPALRERPADILALAEHFAIKYAELNGFPHKILAQSARQSLVANHWKGNVRELENTLHRAVLLCTGVDIEADSLVLPDGDDLSRSQSAAARAALTAEAVTRSLVGQTVAKVEQDLILDTLDHCLGNRTHAARILGISIRTLRNKLNEYEAVGVVVPDPGQARISTAA
jgi:two-component system, response regulator FlrC